MSSSSRKFAKACEILLNAIEKEYIEEYYGKGTQIKVRDIVFSPVKRTCIVDCVVVLGELLTEGVLDDEMTRMLVLTMMDKMIYDYSVNVMVSYDV